MLNVLPLDVAANGSSKGRRAPAELGESGGQRGGASGVRSTHVGGGSAKVLAILDANEIARKAGKLFCVKTLGQQVDDFIKREGITPTEMGRRAVTSRQNIENLIAGKVQRVPHYIHGLAQAMRTTVDALLAGEYVYTPKGAEPDRYSAYARRWAAMIDAADDKQRERLRAVAIAAGFLPPEPEPAADALDTNGHRPDFGTGFDSNLGNLDEAKDEKGRTKK